MKLKVHMPTTEFRPTEPVNSIKKHNVIKNSIFKQHFNL